MQAEAVKDLPDHRIFARAGLTAKAPTAIGAGKLADGKRKTVDNADGGIIGQQRLAHETPEALFHGPQIGRLPHKGRAMQVNQRWEEMAPMALEVGEELGILVQS